MVLGRKVTTRRKWKKNKQGKVVAPYKPGREYKAQERMFTSDYFAMIEVTNISEGILADMTQDDVYREGYRTEAEFKAAWAHIHEEPYNALQKVWGIDFEVTQIPPPYDQILEIVPKGTEENLVDLNYMLAKYPALEPIIMRGEAPTREESISMLASSDDEDIIDAVEEGLQEAGFEVVEEHQLIEEGGEISPSVAYTHVEPKPSAPPVTEEDLARVEWTTIEEANAQIELCYQRIRALQNTIDDANTELIQVQKDLGKYQYFVRADQIRSRRQIHRSYEQDASDHRG